MSGPSFPEAERFEAVVRDGRPARRFNFRHETSSTQDLAWTMAERGAPDGSVALAERQTAGRGRRGRAWDSPAGAGLWFSRVVRMAPPAPELGLVVAATALAVAEGVERASGVRALLRWPNDLLVGERKLAGLLADARDWDPRAPLLILGIGINLGQGEDDFPDDLRGVATSVAMERGGGKPVDPAAVLEAVLDALDERLAQAADASRHDALDEAYGARAALLGRNVTAFEGDREHEGVLESVSPREGVLLRKPDGTTVTLRPELARELRGV